MSGKEMLLSKTTIILNKYDNRYKLPVEHIKVGERGIGFVLPFEFSLLYNNYGEFQVNNNNRFQSAIANLVNKI